MRFIVSSSQKNDFSAFFASKWIDPAEIENKVAELRKTGKKIATLNGSFDLMHAGHLHILYEGSQQADVLIVALNTDDSIKRYKSADRPIVPLKERLQMVAALQFVTYVTCFNELDPRVLLGKIRPDVHVNGAEYGSECIEAEVVLKHGGRLHLVSRIPGLATSTLIKKIKTCV